MTISDFHPRMPPPAQDDSDKRQLSEFKKATLRGDPITVYQAILHCSDNKLALPQWLAEHLLGMIADYHQEKTPNWKGKGNGKRPLTVIRRRFEMEMKRRAVFAIRAWTNDKTKYQDMPTNCIKLWNDQEYWHSQINSEEAVLGFASEGLQGIRLKKGGPLLRCSPRTLRRAMEPKNDYNLPYLPARIASVFGLADPDSFFGSDEPLNPHLK